MTMFIE